MCIRDSTYPDPEKGTGAVKITPAHDPNDFEVGVRAGLERPSCINEDATMNSLAGKYEGMDRYECRKAWVRDLEEAGYLVKTEEKVIPVGECYRCHTVIEPMLSDQWFVAMEKLAKPAIEAAKSGKLTHVPERFEKTYLRSVSYTHLDLGKLFLGADNSCSHTYRNSADLQAAAALSLRRQ